MANAMNDPYNVYELPRR